MPAFLPGDRVHVVTLGTGVVRQVRSRGWYVVELKGRAMVVSGASLEPAPVSRRKAPTSPRREDVPDPRAPATLSIDLHGKTAAEAIEVLDAFLNDALLAGASDARVIHGRSGGTLKAAVHARLGKVPAVRHFRLDPGNPGVTIVQF
jgi:DNA mismatch repair protein MutS2